MVHQKEKNLTLRGAGAIWRDAFDLRVTQAVRRLLSEQFGLALGFVDRRGRVLRGKDTGAVGVEGSPTDDPFGQEVLSRFAKRTLTGDGSVVRLAGPSGTSVCATPVWLDGKRSGAVFAEGPGVDRCTELKSLMAMVADELSRFKEEMDRRERRLGYPADCDVPGFEAIVGASPSMLEVFRLLDRVSASESTVLIYGENGTGKELVARAIHLNSTRAQKPFLAQNCSALNDNLLDSELFGHKKGAFTGAVQDKKGLFMMAHTGTFFLDEVGDMSPVLQVKLLRVLQEGTFCPVGGTDTVEVDVRILAATHKDLERMMRRGQFREDLFYRLNVLSVQIPPLRQRKQDIPLLVDHFLLKHAQGRRVKAKRLAGACLRRMMEYDWPGNVRELENEVERLFVLAGAEPTIDDGLLSPRIREGSAGAPDDRRTRKGSLPEAVETLERAMIHDVLCRTRWNKTRAAHELDISRRNLIRKVQKYGLDRRRS